MLASPSMSASGASTGSLPIRRVAVCGAGVMGAQIAAHCINAGVPVVLFDLASESGIRMRWLKPPLRNAKQRPAPLANPNLAKLITPANYDDDLALLADCDLVIEAIAERLDWKRDLYSKLAPALNPQAIIASNTSGLSIRSLADALPDALRARFCGVHFLIHPAICR